MGDFSSFKLREFTIGLQRLFFVLANPPWVDKSANQVRSQVTGSLTTVTTVTNLSTIDAMQGRLLINGQNMAAWAAVVRTRIS